MVKILIIEDEKAIRDSLSESLKLEGYTSYTASDGAKGIEIFKKESPDLVILDVMMPGVDGLEVCRQIRAVSPIIPIIMLTAKGTELDKVLGLELGADDYLTKPFGTRELFARVKALLRRRQVVSSNNSQNGELEKLQFSDVDIDFKSYRAQKAGKSIELSAKEYEVIKFLASQPDVAVTRDQLLDRVWGYNSYPTTRTVDNFIARLRQKVENTPEKPKHILTVHGVGYKFIA